MNQPLFASEPTLQLTGEGGFFNQWGGNLQSALTGPMMQMGLGLLTNNGRMTPGLMQAVQGAQRLGMQKEDREDEKKRKQRSMDVLAGLGGQAGLMAQLQRAQGAAQMQQPGMGGPMGGPMMGGAPPPTGGAASMLRPPMSGGAPPGPGMQAAMGGPPRPFPSGPPSSGPPGSSRPSIAGLAKTLLESRVEGLQQQGLGLLVGEMQKEPPQPKPLTRSDFIKVGEGRFVNLRTGQVTPWSMAEEDKGPVMPFPGKSDFGRQGNLMFLDDMRKLGVAQPTVEQAQAWGAEFSRRKLERPTTLVTDAGHQTIPGVAVRGIAQRALGMGAPPRSGGRPGVGGGGGAGSPGLPRGFVPKRLSEGEKKSIQAGDVLSQASMDLKELAGTFDPTGAGAAGREIVRGVPVLGPMVARGMAPETAQVYEDTAKQWVTRHIFDVSGATAREDEKIEAFRTYFPQPGDKPLAVAKKRVDRMRRAVEAYRKGLRTRKFEGEEQQRVRKQMEIMQVELEGARKDYRLMLEDAKAGRTRAAGRAGRLSPTRIKNMSDDELWGEL